MTWFWYVSKRDEILLDLDESSPRGSRLGACRLRLASAIKAEPPFVPRLAVRDVYIYESATKGHYHGILRLVRPMPFLRRLAWEIQLRSDIYRAQCNLMRHVRRTPAPSLLISPKRWPRFYREPDDSCDCEGQHSWQVITRCPASRRLRGRNHAESFFGRIEKGSYVPALRHWEGLQDLAAFTLVLNRESRPAGELDRPVDIPRGSE